MCCDVFIYLKNHCDILITLSALRNLETRISFKLMPCPPTSSYKQVVFSYVWFRIVSQIFFSKKCSFFRMVLAAVVETRGDFRSDAVGDFGMGFPAGHIFDANWSTVFPSEVSFCTKLWSWIKVRFFSFSIREILSYRFGFRNSTMFFMLLAILRPCRCFFTID